MLITALIVLVIVGVVLYCFNQFVTMDQRFKNVINAIVCLIAFLYVLGLFFPGHTGNLLSR